MIEHGKLSKRQLQKVKLDVNDLMQDAREDGIFDLSEIDYAIMEVSGKVTFLPKKENMPVTLKDMNIKSSNKGLSAVLVIDGNIMKNNLKNFGKDEKWLLNKIKESGYTSETDILLLLCNNDNKITIYDKYYQVSGDMLE